MAGIKKFKSINKKCKKKHDKIRSLTKCKLNSTEVLTSSALTDSKISHDEFVLINNVLKIFYDMKEDVKTSNKNYKFKLYKTMLSYYLKCRRNTESKNPKVARIKSGRIMFLSKCVVCNSKNSKFIKEQEASGLLSS